MKGYKYVYSLLDNGQVFYVGCTVNLLKRYMQHINTTQDCQTPVKKYISNMLLNGVYPEINIICYMPDQKALAKEFDIITAFSLSGQFLTNHQNYYATRKPKGKYNIHSHTNRKNILNIVRHRQDVFYFHNGNRDEQGNQISRQYPIEPILK